MFASKGRHRKPTTRRLSLRRRTAVPVSVDQLAGHDILAARDRDMHDRDMQIAAALTHGVPIEHARSVWARPMTTAVQ